MPCSYTHVHGLCVYMWVQTHVPVCGIYVHMHVCMHLYTHQTHLHCTLCMHEMYVQCVSHIPTYTHACTCTHRSHTQAHAYTPGLPPYSAVAEALGAQGEPGPNQIEGCYTLCRAVGVSEGTWGPAAARTEVRDPALCSCAARAQPEPQICPHNT